MHEEDVDYDDSDSEEVFYDHHCGALGDEPSSVSPKKGSLPQQPSPSPSSTSLIDARKGSGDTFPASTFTSTAPLAPRDGSHTAASARPALARVIDASVMTMDNAVRVPSALRSAGRRTMFDVLADWKAAQAREQAVPPQPLADTEEHNRAPRARRPTEDVASAARAVTYKALFPRSALTSTNMKEAGLASVPHPLQRGVFPSSKPITVPSTTESGASPTTSGASTAVVTHGSATATAAARTSGTPSMGHAESVSAAASVVHSADATTKQPVAPTKPDRRLRHLLPAYLRGIHGDPAEVDAEVHQVARATETGTGIKTAPARGARARASDTTWAALLRDEQLGSRRHEECKDGAAAGEQRHTKQLQHVDASDISSISTDSLVDADRGDGRVNRPTAQSRCVAVGGSAEVPESFLARLVEADVSGWEAGVTSPRQSQQNTDRRLRTTQSGWGDLEVNLVRSTADMRHSRSSRGRNSDGDDNPSPEHARASRGQQGVLDLNRLIDDEMPPWLLRHQEEESRRQQRCAALQQQQRQEQRALAASSLGAVLPLEEEQETAAKRLAAAQRLMGKPTRFWPSSTAPRNTTATTTTTTTNAAFRSGFGRPPSPAAAAPLPLPVPPPPAASGLRATWKVGARLLKQLNSNATAVGVMEYLWHRFLEWKPCGLRLLGQLCRGVCLGGRATPPLSDTPPHADDEDDENEGTEVEPRAVHSHRGPARAHDDRSSSIEDISLSSGDTGDEEQHQRKRTTAQRLEAQRTTPRVVAAAAAEAEDGSEGVEIQFLALQLEAAFNLVTVRGELTWASETACQRLGVSYPLATLSTSPALLHSRRQWTLLLPEPALMQVPMGLHEHLYLAQPYTVFADTHAILSSYNFTTDELLRQHGAADAGSGDGNAVANEERETEGTQAAGRDHRQGTGAQERAETEARYGDQRYPRQRGVSPVRGSPYDAVTASTSAAAQAAVYTVSPYGRSPVEVGEATGTRQGGTSPDTQHPVPVALFHNVGCATPQEHLCRTDEGAGEEPANIAASVDPRLRTPERTAQGGDGAAAGVGGTCVTASPDPHPPQARLAHAGDDTPAGPHAAVPRLQYSTSPSHVRPTAGSVNSIAGDGFYDPLAMPALPTTDAAVRQGRLAAAARFGDASGPGGSPPSDFTVVLTGASEEARPVPGEGSHGRSHLLPPAAAAGAEVVISSGETECFGLSTRALPIPPPLCVTSRPDTTGAAPTATAAVAAPMVWGAPLLDDTMGNGFARGPGAEWDVPVEALFALSRGCHLGDVMSGDDATCEAPGAKDGSGEDDWGSTTCSGWRGGLSYHHEHTSGHRGSSSTSTSSASSGSHQVALHRRKRHRYDTNRDEGDAMALQHEQHLQRCAFSSTMSFPTPVRTPDSTASPTITAGVGEHRATSSASSSSLSSLSEVHEEPHEASRAVPHARASRGTRRGVTTATRQQLLQRERQEQQARWMRVLWGSEGPHDGGGGPGGRMTGPEVHPPHTAARVSNEVEVRPEQHAVALPTSSRTPEPPQQHPREHAVGPRMPPAEAAAEKDDRSCTPANAHGGPLQAPLPQSRAGPHASPIAAAPPLPDDEATTTTTASTGFFALQDVYLSDSD